MKIHELAAANPALRMAIGSELLDLGNWTPYFNMKVIDAMTPAQIKAMNEAVACVKDLPKRGRGRPPIAWRGCEGGRNRGIKLFFEPHPK